mgnify:CR=1 FL=1
MNILVVDDEKEIADVVELYLQNDQYKVFKFYNGQDALDCINNMKIDLAILDIMLPDIDGFQILKQIRQKYTFPVIMLTAKTEYMDKITGLTLGADDYIPKPFRMMELISRVRALLRRAEDNGAEEYRMENLYVCPGRHEVTVDQEPVNLTLKEYEMLCLLLKNSGTVLSRTQLLNQIWGYEFDGESRTVDVHIRTLRQKLGPAGDLVETVRGVGYKISGKCA